MEVRAVAKYVRVQPRKVRIIADEIRGKRAEYAAALLRYHTSKSARALRKVLISAMANAQENNDLAPESLKVAAITVDEGPRIKRMLPKAMGRGARIVKKTSHITVVVEDAPAPARVKPHGTKAKARPTFAAPKPKKGAAKAKKTEEAPVAEPEAEKPEEATPVTAAEAPEEVGSAGTVASQEETATEEGASQE